MAYCRCNLKGVFEEKKTKLTAKFTGAEPLEAEFGDIQRVSSRYSGTEGEEIVVEVDNRRLEISAHLSERASKRLNAAVQKELEYPAGATTKAARSTTRLYAYDGEEKHLTLEQLKAMGTKVLVATSEADEQIKELDKDDYVVV